MQYIAYISIAISILGFLLTYFGFIQKQADRAVALENRLTKIEMKTDLFWETVRHAVLPLMKSPTHIEKDTLVDKLYRREITIPEAERLRAILADEMELLGRDNGVIGYVLSIGLVQRTLYDLREQQNHGRRWDDSKEKRKKQK